MKKLLKFVYIIDSGFKAMNGISLVNQNYTIDCLGHGTRMYEIIRRELHPIEYESIKVFECSASVPNSNILKAISYVLTRPKGIVNMSLNSKQNAAIETGIDILRKSGFVVSTASEFTLGNETTSVQAAKKTNSIIRQSQSCVNRNKAECKQRKWCKYVKKCMLKK